MKFKYYKFKSVLLIITISSLFTLQSFGQVSVEITNSLKTGNAKLLSGYFNQNVELVVLTYDNVYSKAQATQIVAEFFQMNVPESFSIVHYGGKEGSNYVIGNLRTKTGNFRVYFLLKQNEGKDYIHILRIDKQE